MDPDGCLGDLLQAEGTVKDEGPKAEVCLACGGMPTLQ